MDQLYSLSLWLALASSSAALGYAFLERALGWTPLPGLGRALTILGLGFLLLSMGVHKHYSHGSEMLSSLSLLQFLRWHPAFWLALSLAGLSCLMTTRSHRYRPRAVNENPQIGPSSSQTSGN